MAFPPIHGLSLCSGAGGLELGLHLALGGRYRTVCWVEWEARAAANLVARMEDEALDAAPVWSDLRTFDGGPWRGVVDLISAGFPCQPFSVAGKQRGVEDPRHLWPHVERVIGEVQPGLVFLENVPGLLSVRTPDGRHAYELVEEGLQGMGYRVAPGLYSAAEVGASHRRERLFILAHSASKRHNWTGKAWGRRDESANSGSSGDVGHTNLSRLEGWLKPHREGGHQFPAWPPGPEDRDHWATILRQFPELAPAIEPPVRRMANGLARGLDVCVCSRAERLRLTGNGVVPQQAALAFSALSTQLGVGQWQTA